MATRYLTRSLFTATKQSITSAVSRSYTTSVVLPNNSSSFLFRLRPLVAASCLRRAAPVYSVRGLSTRPTTSSLNDPNPNWSNRPPKETILLDGCDFEHWLVVMEKPEGEPTRDEIIDSYIKTLAMVVGSEADARMKIYSVSTRHYFAFGALVSEELSYKLKDLPKVRWVLPDSYLDVKNKDYGGEPFINGEAVPYDPKYHAEWVRNNARANERNRRNDRPRNFDRSRNFERRREVQMNNQNNGGNFGGPDGGNFGGPAGGNMGNQPGQPGPMQPNIHLQQPNVHPQQPNMQQQPNVHPQQPNMQQQPNMHPQQPNMQSPQPNMQPQQPNYGGGVPPPPPKYPSNYQYSNGPNYQSGPVPNQNFNPNMGSGFGPNGVPGQPQGPNLNNFPTNPGYGGGQNQNSYVPNARPPPGHNQGGYPPHAGPGPGQSQNGYAPNTGGYQNQNVPGRDY